MASGLLVAVPLVVGLFGLARLVPEQTREQSAWVAGLVAVVVSALDILAMGGRFRPWSVGSQVPSLWGYIHGPWKAAPRYGLRLGVGPATILTSWAWWGAMAVATFSSNVGRAISIAAVFVVVRMTLTVAVGFGVSNGVDMSRRMQTIVQSQRRATVTLIALTAFLGLMVVGLAGMAGFDSTL